MNLDGINPRLSCPYRCHAISLHQIVDVLHGHLPAFLNSRSARYAGNQKHRQAVYRRTDRSSAVLKLHADFSSADVYGVRNPLQAGNMIIIGKADAAKITVPFPRNIGCLQHVQGTAAPCSLLMVTYQLL